MGGQVSLSDAENRKICMARYIHWNGLKNEPTPGSVGKRRFSKNWITWSQWWELRFNCPLIEYIETLRQENRL